jgi:hypothetical protein
MCCYIRYLDVIDICCLESILAIAKADAGSARSGRGPRGHGGQVAQDRPAPVRSRPPDGGHESGCVSVDLPAHGSVLNRTGPGEIAAPILFQGKAPSGESRSLDGILSTCRYSR